MAWSRDLAYSSRKNKLHLSSFHPKILHASLSTPTPLATAMTAPHCRYSRTDSDTTSHTSALALSGATAMTAPHRRYSHTDSATTSYTLALALSGAEVLCVAYEPSQIKQNAWAQVHGDYLQINAFPDLVVVEREENPHALQRKATGGATREVVRETAGWTRSGLTLGTSTSDSTRPVFPVWWKQQKVEGLDVTLDGPAVQCTQMDPGGWSDVSAWFIRAVNHVLDRSYFRRDSSINQLV